MFLLLCCLLLFAYLPSSSGSIFRGVEILDQDLEEEITPGGDVRFGSFPYVAAVFNAMRKFHTCAGAIIHSRVVISAGYCISVGTEIVDPAQVSVLAGVVDMRDHDQAQWRYAVAIVKSNVTYMGMNALVLIKVNTPFYINYSLKTIKCSSHRYVTNGICTAVTWSFRDKLQRLTLRSLVLNIYSVFVSNQTSCKNRMDSAVVGDIGFACIVYTPHLYPDSVNYQCVGMDGSMIFCNDIGQLYVTAIASTYTGGSMCNRNRVVFTFFDLGSVFGWINQGIKRLVSAQ